MHASSRRFRAPLPVALERVFRAVGVDGPMPEWGPTLPDLENRAALLAYLRDFNSPRTCTDTGVPTSPAAPGADSPGPKLDHPAGTKPADAAPSTYAGNRRLRPAEYGEPGFIMVDKRPGACATLSVV